MLKMWESNSCVRYLAAKYGKGKLWPADLQIAASASRWIPIERPNLPNLKTWYERLCTRPAYQKHIAGA